MAELKPAYLIHGDDHGGIAERRAGLRALVERGDGGAGSVELLEGESATPAAVARALAAITLPLGDAQPGSSERVILVDGVERWRQSEVEEHLADAMSRVPPGTTLALFAREDSRAKAPPAIADAVRRAGGQVVAQMTVKPWELARWTSEQAARLGLSLDRAAAQALVDHVGERQQRLLRELEKLALSGGDPGAAGGGPGGAGGEWGGADGESGAAGGDPGAAGGGPGGAGGEWGGAGGDAGSSSQPRRVDAEEIGRLAAQSAEWRAYSLADALVAADRRQATLAYLRLRGQGERTSGLTYLMAQRLREALTVALRLEAGATQAEAARGLRMPARAAKRLVADVARSDPDRLRRALGELADLELDSRGGPPAPGGQNERSEEGRSEEGRRSVSALSEDTIALRTIEVISAED
jgi:DNA polymerase III delta subunit